MQINAEKESILKIGLLLSLLLLAAPAAVQTARGRDSVEQSTDSKKVAGEQVRIPSRASKPLFEGKPGRQKTEIHFDPATRTVTIKLVVQDPNGYFIPNLRRDNFVVYENGVRQRNATVEVDHAPVSLVLLMEFGGRMPALNRSLATEVSRTGRQLLDVLGREDKLAVWKYGDNVQKLTGFSQKNVNLDLLLSDLGTPDVSETNLYDALFYAVDQMRSVTGRKAIVLVSSGIDTSSKATYQDLLNTVRNSDTPIYVISLAMVFQNLVQIRSPAEPLAKIDWSRVERELQEIASASGGRTYSPQSTLDLSGIYDDLLENLKVRYVITYQSSSDLDLNTPRTIRVQLVDPVTGGPLKIVDEGGRTIRANVIAQESYVPSAVSAR
ncbi:MAG TPA: VWA domain-containing protein [Terriglobales bacterium]|nr:VWA domain-containing protein [Terriglobales bacterium]